MTIHLHVIVVICTDMLTGVLYARQMVRRSNIVHNDGIIAPA